MPCAKEDLTRWPVNVINLDGDYFRSTQSKPSDQKHLGNPASQYYADQLSAFM